MGSLSTAERQLIIEMLERGEEIPHEFKHILFPPNRKEYELVYGAKQRAEDIIADTMAVPLQAIRTFHSPAIQPSDWQNMLIFGDNLQSMRMLLKMNDAGQLTNADGTPGVRLVYIDPPFASKQEFRGNQEEVAYKDKVAGAKYVEFMRKRLILIHRLLSRDGILFLHLDTRKSHYLKVILDEIFGEHNFRNEIIWKRQSAHNDANKFGAIHDTILFYSKSRDWIWNPLKTPLSPDYVEEFFDQVETETGRRYARGDLTAEGITKEGDSGKPWRGIDPSKKGRHWAISPSELDRLDEQGRIHHPKKGIPRLKRYADEIDGMPLQDIWTDIKILHNRSRERVGYPTQKPEAIAERIILSCTQPGDLVLDAFAGSGTTVAAAEKQNRRWIGIDSSKLSIYTIQKRLLNLKVKAGKKSKTHHTKPFTLYNAGLYDFALLKDLPWDQWRAYGLGLFQCQDEPHEVNGRTLDGYREGEDVLVFNHKLHGGSVLDYEYIDQLHEQIGSKISDKPCIIAPAASVTFLEDYYELGEKQYFIMRIPYSIINELHSRDFEALIQPANELEINQTVEAVGFDFIRTPTVECEYLLEARDGHMLTDAVVCIKTFTSQAMVRGVSQLANLESLSMVMVDYNYPHESERRSGSPLPPFQLDQVFYAQNIKEAGWQVRLPLERFGSYVMLIFADVYGNEYTEVKTTNDFRLLDKE